MEYTDTDRLQWLLDQFTLTDNAWLASFCLNVNQEGIRAEIDERIYAEIQDGIADGSRKAA